MSHLRHQQPRLFSSFLPPPYLQPATGGLASIPHQTSKLPAETLFPSCKYRPTSKDSIAVSLFTNRETAMLSMHVPLQDFLQTLFLAKCPWPYSGRGSPTRLELDMIRAWRVLGSSGWRAMYSLIRKKRVKWLQEHSDSSVDDQACLTLLRFLLGLGLSAFALFDSRFWPMDIHNCLNLPGGWHAHSSHRWGGLESILNLVRAGSTAATHCSTSTPSSSTTAPKKPVDKSDLYFHSHSHCLLGRAVWAKGWIFFCFVEKL